MASTLNMIHLDNAQDMPWETSSDFSDAEHGIIRRDKFHYFTEMTFLVENTLFRVPRRYFEQESEVFHNMFQLPIADDTIPDGCSDEQPLRLDGVLEEDFRQLLRVMFPMRILVEESLSLTEWTSVLKLSAMWQMDRLRQVAVKRMSALSGEAKEWLVVLDVSARLQVSEARELAIANLSRSGTITSMDKILLARKHKVEQWFRDGCQELVQREEYFSDDDEDQLGSKTVIKLYRLRDGYLKTRKRASTRVMTSTNIDKEFAAELKDMASKKPMS